MPTIALTPGRLCLHAKSPAAFVAQSSRVCRVSAAQVLILLAVLNEKGEQRGILFYTLLAVVAVTIVRSA